ncbi:Ig-like domain-containing protein [Paenibacillus contaminans]|uniref:Uncharacterized protein n=1 Tax=Paenibacillus contaminans TaxID=450362 RepID=A0A329MNV4_9BACL|nr:Ig-like domain-containing protein [Paenibacillus contaminans]RAV21220.1 hypothetical protein DQG23_11190 [Paenibacillus contaminans]
MKTRRWKALLACLLSVMMLVSTVTPAFAAGTNPGELTTSNNAALKQTELYQALVDEYGEAEASTMLRMMQQLGAVNGEGGLQTYPVVLNGQSYSLAQLQSLWEAADTDLSQVAVVDGEEITLGQLKKLLEIEKSLGYALNGLEQGTVSITDKHLDSLDGILDQVQAGGVQAYDEQGNLLGYDAAGNLASLPDPANAAGKSSPLLMNAAAPETFIGNNSDYQDFVQVSIAKLRGMWGGTVEAEFALNAAQTVPVSFDYELIAGSQKFLYPDASKNRGTVMFQPGETSKTVTILLNARYQGNVETKDWNIFQTRVYHGAAQADLIHFYNYKNFDRFSYKTSLSNTDYQINYAYNGGAYLSVSTMPGTAGHLQYSNIAGFDNLNYNYAKFYDKANNGVVDRLEANTGKYKTGQLLPINVFFNRPFEISSMYGQKPAATIQLHNGATGYSLTRSGIPTLQEYMTAGLTFGFAAALDKQTIKDYLQNPLSYTGLQTATIDGITWTYDWRYYRQQDFYGNWVKNPTTFIYPDSGYQAKPYANNPDIILTPARADAFTGLSIDKTTYYVGDKIKVNVTLEDTDGFYEWLVNGAITPADIKKRVYASIGDRDNGIIELDWKRDPGGEPVTPLQLEGEYEVNDATFAYLSSAHAENGYLRAKIFYNNGSELNSVNTGLREDMAMLNETFQYFRIVKPVYVTADNSSIAYPATWPSGTAKTVNLISKTATKIAYKIPQDTTFKTADQFVWSSNDESIAAILADGTIVPKQTGTVTFKLTVKNDGRLQPETVLVSDPIEVVDDGSSAIIIPDFANQLMAYQHEDAVMYWSTNVMARYKQLAGSGAAQQAYFKVELFEGYHEEDTLAAQTPVATWSAPQTAGLINTTNFKIPGQYLTNLSVGSQPTYTLRVSTVNPENTYHVLSATAHIIVRSPAVKIQIDRSAGQAFTDQVGSIPITWTLQNFDGFAGSEFEFEVTRNGTLVPGSKITYDAQSGQFTSSSVRKTDGDFVLQFAPVDATEHRLKDNYVVTIKAKNSADSTWSYDSYYLYVYDSDVLNIQVDGQQQSQVTLSNIDRISRMTSEDILALKRDITLVKNTSINHADFTDLNLITDQIAWNVDDSHVATLNYGTYGNLASTEEYGYSSYLPKSLFQLTGLETGQTKVSATHARTGMKVDLDVTVETLRDKLYLFQLYPKAETTVNYSTMENGLKVERTVQTNANGELALYEENGIVSDVYVTSFYDNSTYTGVIDQLHLKSKEQNPATRQLYPVNILQLRRLAEVDVYLKKPDGKPYVGEVTYRGGVYRNGRYAKPAEVGVDTVYTVGNDGRLKVIFDTTDFYDPTLENNASSLSAKDEIEIILEVQFANDAYYPIMVYSSGNANPVDRIEFGDKVQQLRANASGKRETFVYAQSVKTNGSYTRIDLLNYSGKFGPNDQFKMINLATEFMWWGETTVGDSAKAELVSNLGTLPDGQSSETMKYPFSDYYTTRHVQVLNAKTIWLDKAESGTFSHRLYNDRGEFLKSFNTRATLVNMIGVPGVDIYGLKSEISRVRNDMAGTSTSTSSMSNNDRVMMETLKLLGKFNLGVGPMSMQLYPTDDPMVYRTIMRLHTSNVPSATSSTAGGNASVSFFQKNSQSFAPGAGDMKSMALGSYAAEQRSAFAKAQAEQGSSSKGPMYTVSGYYMGELRYNTQTAKWDNIVQAGGFTAGGGFQYQQVWNMMAGFVPVTFSIDVGAAVEVSFHTSVLYEQISGYPWADPTKTSVNDYLTSLRIVAYAEAFGGIGFDLSVIAMKIGLFGRLQFDNTATWLNRNYLADTSERVLSGDKLNLTGIAGIRVVLKFLFISISYDLASFKYSRTWLFKNWDKIEKYWNANSKQALTSKNAARAISLYLESIGQPEMAVLQSTTVESRDYLQEYERSWKTSNGGGNARLRSTFAGSGLDSKIDTLQTNAYPFSNPLVADDGSLFVYLSDAGSTNVADTAASWAKVNAVSGLYENQGPITTDPAMRRFGDSSLQIDGENDFVAAVWVTQKQPLAKETGETITNEEILLMNNGTEVMAGIYDGGTWTTYPLTDNLSPDLAPVVAVSNDKVFVAYRNAYSQNVNNPFDFTSFDSILYRVYDRTTKTWSDPELLYNGSNGTIMGISATALSDGTSAVAYALNNGGRQDAADNEIVYTVVDTSKDAAAAASTWKTKGIVKSVQLTSNQWADENPKLTSVRWTDGSERFVLAWYKTSVNSYGSQVKDIPLAAIRADGELDASFVDSLSDLTVSMSEQIDPNFVFANMSRANNTVDNLSIVWKDSEVNTDEATGETVSRDRLRAVKFGAAGNQFYLSAVQDIGKAEDYTQFDQLSVYVSGADGRQVKGVLLGTTYTTDAFEAGNVTSPDGDNLPVYVSKSVSNLYTSTGYYKNAFNGGQIWLNPEEIVKGFDLPIEFSIVNEGLDRIQEVEISVNGVARKYPVNLLPNSTEQLIYTYSIPNTVGNISFTVKATFANGDELEEQGRIILDIADVGMSDISMQAEGGSRKLYVPLYNKNDASLAGNKKKTVKLGLYSNTIFTDEYAIGVPVEIKDELSLGMIDNGGYVAVLDFDVKSYLAAQGKTEIPDDGLYVYLHAWIEDEEGHVVTEFDDTNNVKSVYVERLALKYNKPLVRMETEQDNTGTGTKVAFSMQNMNMAPIANGNVVMYLLDQAGVVLETQYLRASTDLLQLGSEQTVKHTFNFTQKGYDIRAEFYQESLDGFNKELSMLTMSGVPLSFKSNGTSYDVNVRDLASSQLVAVAANRNAAITIKQNGLTVASGTGNVTVDVALLASASGTANSFEIWVKSYQGGPLNSSQVYTVNLTNTSTGIGKLTASAESSNPIKPAVYWDDASVYLSEYVIDGYEISKAQVNINNQGWVDATNAYDGSQRTEVAKATAPDTYEVRTRIVFKNGTIQEANKLEFVIENPVMDPVQSTMEPVVKEGVAGGTTPITVPVILRNANGYPLAGKIVELTQVSGVASTIQPVQPVTDADGKAIFQITSGVLGSAAFEAKEKDGASLSQILNLTFKNGGISLTRTTVQVESGVYANNLDEASVTVSVYDAAGNPLSNHPLYFYPISFAGSFSVDQNTGYTDGNGMYTARFKSDTANVNQQFKIDFGSGLTVVKSIRFIPGPFDGSGNGMEIALLGNTATNVMASGSDSRTIQVTLRDRAGLGVANKTVSLAADLPGVTISSGMTATNVNGEMRFTVSGTTLGEATLTAVEAETQAAKTIKLNFVPGPFSSTNSEASITKTTMVAGSTDTATVTTHIRDAFGHPIANLSVRMEAQRWTGTGTVPTQWQTTDADGKVEFTVVAQSYGGVQYRLFVGSNPQLFKLFDVLFDYGTASESNMDVYVSKREIEAKNSSDLAEMTVTVKNDLGHYIPNAIVRVSSESPNVRFSSTTLSTGTFGQATFGVYGEAAGTATIKITVDGSSAELTETVKVIPAPIQDYRTQLTRSIDKLEVLGNNIDQATLTITAKDRFNNPYAGADVEATVSNWGVSFAVYGTTDAAGQAVIPIRYAGSGTFNVYPKVTYEGSSASLPQISNLTFVQGPVNLLNADISVDKQTFKVGEKPKVTIVLKAENGLPYEPTGNEWYYYEVEGTTGDGNQPYAQRLDLSYPQGQVPYELNISQTGEASLAVYLASYQSGRIAKLQDLPVLTFTTGDFVGNATLTSDSPGGETPASLRQEYWTNLQATTTDVGGNPVSGRTISLRAYVWDDDQQKLVIDPKTTIIATGSNMSGADGTVTFKAKRSEAGDVTFEMVDEDLEQVVGYKYYHRFTQQLFDPEQSRIETDHLERLADGVESSLITIHMIGTDGQPMVGQYLNYYGYGTDKVQVEELDNQSGSDANGVYRFKVTSQTPADVIMYFADVYHGISTNVPVMLRFVTPEQKIDTRQSTVAAADAAVVADGKQYGVVAVEIVDLTNTPIAYRKVQLIGLNGSSDIDVEVLETDADGKAWFYVSNDEVEEVTYKVVDVVSGQELEKKATMMFVAGNLDVTRSSVTSTHTEVPADGQSAATIEAALVDADGHPLPGRQIRLEATGGQGTIAPQLAVTNSDGKASFTVSRSEVGAITYVVVDVATGLTLPAQMTIHYVTGAPDANRSEVAVRPSAVVADGSSKATISVALKDASGHALPGAAVRLAANGGNSTITAVNAVTDASGAAAFEVSNAEVGQVSYTAYAALSGYPELAIAQQANVSFVNGDLDLNRSSVTAATYSVLADGISAIDVTVALQDTNGLEVINRELKLQVENQPGRTWNATTNEHGAANFEVTSSTVEDMTVYVTDVLTGLELQSKLNLSFKAGAVDVHASGIAVAPAAVPANGTDSATITVTIQDAYQHVLGGQTVSLMSNGVAVGMQTTDSNGKASFAVTNSVVENKSYHVYVSVNGQDQLLGEANVMFTNGRIDAAASTIVTDTQTPIAADGTANAAITVTAVDEYGHLMANREIELLENVTNRHWRGVTDASGKVQFLVNGTVIAQRTYRAYDAAGQKEIQGSVTLTFIAGAASRSASTVAVAPNEVKADGVSEAKITVTVSDAYGHVLPNHQVSLRAVTGSAQVKEGILVTNQAGQAVFTVVNDRAEKTQFEVAVTGGNTSIVLDAKAEVNFVSATTTPPTETNPTPVDPTPVDPKPVDPVDPEPIDEEQGLFKSDILDIEKIRARFRAQLARTAGEDGAARFSDLAGHWATMPVGLFARLDGIRGYSDGTVRADHTITRAEFASLLVQLLEIENTGTKQWSLRDIDSHWAYESIAVLAGHGVINGYSDSTFRPDQTITREEMVTLLLNLVNVKALPKRYAASFTDSGQVSPYAVQTVQAASNAGIVSGYPDGTFQPQGNVTRAEAVVMLANLLQLESGIRALLQPELAN